MNICMDIQAAVAQRAGIGRYARTLAGHLPPFLDGVDLTLFYFDFKRQGEPFTVPGATLKPCRMLPGQIVQKLWQTADWPEFQQLSGPADLYHFPNFLIPPINAKARTVVSIHDMSFMRFPEFAEDRNREFLTSRLSDTIERADGIITISEFSASEIVEFTGAPRDKIHVTHLGITGGFSTPSEKAQKAMRKELGIDGPYVLTVSTLEPRKNVDFLVDVFEQMKDFDGHFVIAGMRGWKYESTLQRIEESPLRDRIHYVEYVSDEHLPALYGSASLFLFGSHYEGFGFTPLEAMACGLPVLSSDGGSLAEVLRDGAVVMSGFDAGEWAEQAARLLQGDSERDALCERGRAVAGSYTWEATARNTAEIYRGLMA